MKLGEKFKNMVFRKIFASSTAVNLNDPAFWSMFGNVRSGALSQATYFTCLKVLMEAVAKLPLKLYKNTEEGIVKATDIPLYQQMKIRPNRNMTATAFWSYTVANMYHNGNMYYYPANIHNPKKFELVPIDPTHITIYDDNALIISHNDRYVWYIYTEPTTGKVIKFREDEILHFKPPMTLDGITGIKVRDYLSMMVDGAISAQKFKKTLYETGLTGKVAVEYTQDLSEPLKKQLVKTIEAAADAEKAINFIPIPSGMKLQPLNLKLTDAQFMEMDKYSALQIAAAFGVKPNQLNDYEKSSYANSEIQQQAFLTDTLLVVLKGIEEELTYKLLTEEQINAGYFFKFNVDVVLRATFAARMQGYAQARQNGWMSANDIREIEDMPYIPQEEGGNLYLVNGNMKPIQQAGGE